MEQYAVVRLIVVYEFLHKDRVHPFQLKMVSCFTLQLLWDLFQTMKMTDVLL